MRIVIANIMISYSSIRLASVSVSSQLRQLVGPTY